MNTDQDTTIPGKICLAICIIAAIAAILMIILDPILS
jgi:hypothetical protein